MEHILQSGDTKAVVELDGAYIATLQAGAHDIFYPKQTMTLADGTIKQRGGSHVCLPQFGPGGENGLEQHGYGRQRTWSMVEASDTEITLSLDGEGAYSLLRATLTYRLSSDRLVSTLELCNIGSDTLAVAPAFHPYFAYDDSFQIDGTVYSDLSVFEGTLFVDGNQHVLEDSVRRVVVHSDTLQRWALWTDQLAEYICIEPTWSGNVFAEDMARADILAPDQCKRYDYWVSW